MKISSLAGSHDTSPTECNHLQHYIDESKKEKCSLISVMSRLEEDVCAHCLSTEEIQTLHTNIQQARQEWQALESQVHELWSTGTANKFKSRLSQQLRLAQDETATITSELTSKFDEYAHYCCTKHAKFEQLVTIMEECEKQAKNIIESIACECAGVGDLAEKCKTALQAEAEKERHVREEVEKQLEQLGIVLERIIRASY
ncbi:hypothetical protein EDC04DRAFT_2613597 [Pisolithus marmoratus]|nr:hypothetical protein EDC04DRAFT_2613597 [Pisolithus marmoratus]